MSVFPPQIHYNYSKNWGTSRLIVKKYELFLALIFFKCVIFLHKYIIILRNIDETHFFFVSKWQLFQSKYVDFSAKFKLETLHSYLALWNWKSVHAWKREIYILAQKRLKQHFCSTFFHLVQIGLGICLLHSSNTSLFSSTICFKIGHFLMQLFKESHIVYQCSN